jgi:hypothetical protein
MNDLKNKYKTEINIPVPADLTIDSKTFKKMAFIYNAVETGWQVNKKNSAYHFTKKHEGKKEMFLDSYLSTFIEENMNINGL